MNNVALGEKILNDIHVRDLVCEEINLIRTYLIILESVISVHASRIAYPANYPR